MKPHSEQLVVERLENRTLMATCHVTRLSDTGIGNDFNGDLRYCINKVNAEPGTDTIKIVHTGTINLGGALPNLQTNIDLQGPGADLLTVRRDTAGSYRIFSVGAPNVKISGITITNGFAPVGATYSAQGGGIYNGGGLTVRNSVITRNTADNYWIHEGAGGGIYNAVTGRLTVIDTTISNNVATGATGGIGGGICNEGNAWIFSSTIIDNEAGGGGGGFDPGSGGGVSNGCSHYPKGRLQIVNSTIKGNQASVGGGGGVFANGYSTLISHSTITANGGGIQTGFFDELHLSNNVVAGNSWRDISGRMISSGYNLIGNRLGGRGYVPTDILDVDPLLGSLADNGGPTLTMALLPGSPAIDAGDNADAPKVDQRGSGFPRIVNGTIDIGAFEVQALATPRQPEFLAFLITADSDKDQQEPIP